MKCLLVKYFLEKVDIMVEKFVLTGKNDDKPYRISLPAAKHFESLTANDLNLLHRQSQNRSTKELEDME